MHDKRLYHVVDQYCPNPRCTCDRVLVDFYELTERGRHVGHADASLGAVRQAKIVGEPVTAFLWKAVLDQHGVMELRRRKFRIIDVVDDDEPTAEPRRVEKKIGRNDPCPCGSGKMHKRCCVRESANN